MNDESLGRHPFTVAAWILVVAVVVAIGAGVAGDILSSSLVPDLAAMWPLLVAVVLAGAIGWLRGRRHRRRAGAILPLAIFTALVLGVAVHLAGWEELPSAETSLTGPPVSELSDPTELTVQIVGDLVIGPLGKGAAYRVVPILRGGQVGVPQAVETSVDGDVAIELEAADAPAWYSFSGWEIGLSRELTWRLVLNGRLDADFTSIPIASMAVAGSGTLALGSPPEEGGSIVAAGDITFSVPADTAVEVEGEAEVPEGWKQSGSVRRSPTSEGAGWRIRVAGDGPVSIRER